MNAVPANPRTDRFRWIESISHSGGIIPHILFMFLIVPAMAQVSIKGTVRDQNKAPVPYASVLLLNTPDSTLASGTMTDDLGSFALSGKEGSYILNVSMIGYGLLSSRIRISAGEKEIQMDSLVINENYKELEGVVVKAQRPFFEKKMDRININLQNSPTAIGSTALEILARSPGVTVDRQNKSISMNGKSGVQVMIDGKASRMPMDAVVQMLDGMSSANIAKIELITTPPAKYDAEGNAGIINIVMKSNPEQGLNGNAGVTAGYGRGGILGTNFRVNQRSKKVNVFLSYSMRHDRVSQSIEGRRYYEEGDFTQTDFSYSERKPKTTVHDLHAGLEYDPDKKTKISFLAGGYYRKWDMLARTENLNGVSPDTIYNTDMSINETNIWKSLSLGTDVTRRFGERHEVSLNFDYLHYDNNNPSGYVNERYLNSDAKVEEENIAVSKLTPVNFKITGLDYTFRTNPKLLIESGMKATFSDFSNDVAVLRSEQDEMIMDPKTSSSSSLNEKIYAAYGSFEWTATPKLNIHGGLRYEYTHSVLDSALGIELKNRESGYFFPGLSLNYELNEQNRLQFSYYRRITRPTFTEMAPFVFFFGPKTFFAGNLDLRPAIMDGVELGYNLKQWWITFKYSYTKDEIAGFQPEIDPESGVQTYRSQNLDYLKTFGISLILPFTITSWWKMQNDLSFYLQAAKTLHYEPNVKQKMTNMIANSANSFILPWKLTGELFLKYNSASIIGITKVKASGAVNIGIKKEFNPNSSLSLAFNDIFNTSVMRFETNSRELNIHSVEYLDFGFRSVTLTFSYNFGSRTVKDVNIHSHTDDESNRVRLQ